SAADVFGANIAVAIPYPRTLLHGLVRKVFLCCFAFRDVYRKILLHSSNSGINITVVVVIYFCATQNISRLWIGSSFAPLRIELSCSWLSCKSYIIKTVLAYKVLCAAT